tara:strand:+ start:11250 stop:13013 length:1764 start_codon:yes stop_codon:yes gene_type:complete
MPLKISIPKCLLTLLLILPNPISWAIAPMQIKVKMTGISEVLQEEVKSDLSLYYLRGDPVISPSLMDVYIDRAEEEIALALQPYGYYNPIIHSHKKFENNNWQIVFNIQQGSPVVIKNIHIQLLGQGKNNAELNKKVQAFPLKIGDVFSHETYELGKKNILGNAVLLGFLSAEFTEHRVEVDVDSQQAQIYLQLDTNAMYYFGQTRFSDSQLNNSLLNRYITYDIDDSFSAKKLVLLEDRLRKSDYFKQVNIQSLPDHEQFRVPVLVELEDNKPNHYILGIGYGTDTGARGKAGYLRRRVNSSGHKFQTEVQLSQIFQKIEADYIIPGKRPYSDKITLHTEYIEDEYSDKPVDSFELGISEKRDIYGWERTLDLTFLKEQSVSFSTNTKRKDKLLIPMLEVKKSIRDDPNNPKNGTTRIFKVKGSVENIGSDISFAQIYYQHRWLHTFENDIKSLFRIELGATTPQTEDKVPLSQRFFAGGDTSIRGFAYRSLPAEIDKDDVRQPVGGSYLFISSLEFSKPIKAPLGGHVFVDTGNAFRSSRDNLQVGVGVGLNYDTRFGPIKFSVAKPLTNAANSWRIHATFGPEV